MKHIKTFLGLVGIIFVTGCAANAPQIAKAPIDVEEDNIVLPAELLPPGQVEMAWEPEAQPEPAAAPRPKPIRNPGFVSNRNTRGRLFVLPTTREN